jgi:predicted RNA methylase
MSGLDEQQRTDLARIVIGARNALWTDVADTLVGVYGIHGDGRIEDEGRIVDDGGVRARRRTLVGILEHLRADGLDDVGAVERLTREATFTHLNRLIAIRIADALGMLEPSLRDGAESRGFTQWRTDIAPLLATDDDTGGYWRYLQQCADELAADAPALFDPRNPLLALRPSKAALDVVVALLSDAEDSPLWDGDDTFGWAYQFFNTREERQGMRDGAAPADAWELAVRNQFFTPAYVVRFLTQNSLGRRLLDADPSSPLLDELPLLIDPPSDPGAPIDLAEVRVLDPACGSGHFLLGCYDILEAAWRLAGVEAADAAPKIVPCLWGIDIDPRAVQVAQVAIVFRARRACGREPLTPPNVVCARALPDDPSAWSRATDALGVDHRRLVESMRDALRDAPVLGPLLKAEQKLAADIRSTVAFADATVEDDLLAGAGLVSDAFGRAEHAVLHALQSVADTASSSAAERLLAAEAADAVRFVEAARNRYDAVLMNPPFGEPVPKTKPYIKAAYPWIPTRDYNLLAAFVGRGLELCNEHGYLGAITSRTGMFLKTAEQWRNEVLLGNRMFALADLGFGVMEQAMVEAAAYVLGPGAPEPEDRGVFIRLLKTQAIRDLRGARQADRRDIG